MTPSARSAILTVFPGARFVGEPEPAVNRCAICATPCKDEACGAWCSQAYSGYRWAMRRDE